ncbi:MAG: DUF2490 domain-containing protein [Candidatus Omnitrophica bacterium]|nr:DUF2490 domain-containing protein [Candidatus Omnitrophota bacterium]MBU1869794.1 DUF2490 domain-containing protein [Candidatus Omnitrophota bacterium]
MKRIFVMLIGLALSMTVEAFAYDNHDFQVWNTDAEEFKLNDNSKVVFEQEFRWGDNAHEFFYQHYDAGYFYNIKKWLQVGGGYRHVLSKSRGKFKEENEPYITTTVSWDWLKCAIDSRSRLEYNHFDYQEDVWRYRNKFTMKLPWKFTKFNIRPYISDEVFVKFSGWSGLNQNRLYGGFALDLAKNFRGEIYYMLLGSKSQGRWQKVNVLGTKFKISF